MEWSCLKPLRLWGDYGAVLAGGYYRRDDAGLLRLHRAGPFLPPISFPWGPEGRLVVVSDEFRAAVQGAGFPGIQFREAVKDRIVALDWHTWNRSAADPRQFPPSGEPEEYIWDEPHDPRAARQMPLAWELIAPLIEAEYEEIPELQHELVPPSRAVLPRREYPPWFGTLPEYGDQVLAPEAREWVERAGGEWVRFANHCDGGTPNRYKASIPRCQQRGRGQILPLIPPRVGAIESSSNCGG